MSARCMPGYCKACNDRLKGQGEVGSLLDRQNEQQRTGTPVRNEYDRLVPPVWSCGAACCKVAIAAAAKDSFARQHLDQAILIERPQCNTQ